MGNLLSYSGIVTKIRAMEANLISKEDYQAIAELESTADFIAFLKNHPGYAELFNNYDERGIHRGQAERIFVNGLYYDFSKIYGFANLEQRKDLDFIFFRYEVNILKACLQMVFTNSGDYGLNLFTSFFNHHSDIDVKALAASHSMEEYINNLKDTEYYSLLYNLQNTEGVSPFDYQMQLDIYYFKKAWQLKDKFLNGENLNAMTHRLGSEIDLLNIMWLYRSKKFFSVRSTDSYAYVIPITYKLTRDNLMQLMETTTIEELITILKTTYYEKISLFLADGSIENTSQKLIAKIYKDNMSLYPASMSPVNYYLFLKQNEIKRLTTALECIRYKLEPQDTLKYVLL
ncbi:MAG: V-type ATPase subunit [Anaerocolumna sp.]